MSKALISLFLDSLGSVKERNKERDGLYKLLCSRYAAKWDKRKLGESEININSFIDPRETDGSWRKEKGRKKGKGLLGIRDD